MSFAFYTYVNFIDTLLDNFLSVWIAGGTKDLKIYADLALLSVEGDEHVARVTNLHSATLGYSAVIYGDMFGEDDMIHTWKEVWKNLKKDEHLPEKLVAFLNSLSAEC